VIVAVPVVLAVKVTAQLADGPEPDRVHVGALKLPVTPATDQDTVPVGVVGVPLVSVTVAVHDVETPRTIVDGVQTTAVVVVCGRAAVTVNAKVPELPEWAASPP